MIHETPLYQLIQYAPATGEVLETPLIIFPPWINRFYILDLNPKKSFVKWALDQGLTVFMVSWRSADESLAHIEWDDYVRAQIEAIEVVRERLQAPAVHAIGYCVAAPRLPPRWRSWRGAAWPITWRARRSSPPRSISPALATSACSSTTTSSKWCARPARAATWTDATWRPPSTCCAAPT